MYSFIVLDEKTLEIKVHDQWGDVDQKGFEKFTNLKKRNSSLKTMVAIGGWVDSQDGSRKYSKLVSDPKNIQAFTKAAVEFLQKYNFDGLDLDWEYPSSTRDKKGFANLVIALKTAFTPKNLLLSAAVSASPSAIDAGK